MKTIVIGDIHGCYHELEELLLTLEERGEYTKGVDKLVFLGDYIDRGENSRLVIETIRNLQENYDNVIALMGNHEDMLLNYIDGFDNNWIYNGHYKTVDSYRGYFNEFISDVEWMRNLPLYHEDEHFVYVHAGIDAYKPMEKQDRNTLLWVREPFIYGTKKYHKKVIFGHTPTMSGYDDVCEPTYTLTDNIDIDTGCVYGGALTALIIEDGVVDGYYSVNNMNNEIKA